MGSLLGLETDNYYSKALCENAYLAANYVRFITNDYFISDSGSRQMSVRSSRNNHFPYYSRREGQIEMYEFSYMRMLLAK